jgi:hypothetical protein
VRRGSATFAFADAPVSDEAVTNTPTRGGPGTESWIALYSRLGGTDRSAIAPRSAQTQLGRWVRAAQDVSRRPPAAP